MIRFIVRAAGYLLLAGAFVAMVIDGTRSIAASSLAYSVLRDALERAAPGRTEALRGLVEHAAGGAVWTRLVEPVLGWPLVPVLLVLGLVLVRLAAPPAEEVGYVARR